MGCTVSTVGIEVVPDKPLKEYLWSTDIQVVKETWKMLEDNREQFGLIMFQRYECFCCLFDMFVCI